MAHYKYGETIQLHVGGYLKHELKKMRKTQEDFADEFGTSPRNARRWIKYGVANVATIAEIANYLGVSVRDILSEEDSAPSPHLLSIMLLKSDGTYDVLSDFFVFDYTTAMRYGNGLFGALYASRNKISLLMITMNGVNLSCLTHQIQLTPRMCPSPPVSWHFQNSWLKTPMKFGQLAELHKAGLME